jgi:pyruvate dehydrogenase E1 component alpha subunit
MYILGVHTMTSVDFYHCNAEETISSLGKESLLAMLKKMLLIRQFELRAEANYLAGKIGGFLHLYIGQEAIETAAVQALGPNQWYSTTYRCHALALLLGETPSSLMAELLGKKNGNALGRGGSMHMFSKRMLGGFGIVGGQIPIATGAAFSCKYTKEPTISVCFMGDGAVAQGVFHESLNLASMWSLPCLYVIENNQWSMGTPLYRTLSHYDTFLRDNAKAFDIPYLRLDGMDIIQCYAGFSESLKMMHTLQKPMVIECITERFRGHSVSDPGLYRTKDDLKKCMEKDPIPKLKATLLQKGWLSEEEFSVFEKEAFSTCTEATLEAEKAPWPDPIELEEDVFAPETEVSR